MKNIHVLPTDKPTRLFTSDSELVLEGYPATTFKTGVNIYITSDEEIKEGDWFIANQKAHKCIRVDSNTSCPFITLNDKGEEIGHFHTWKTKIILTTDQDLIKNDVRAINDTFLEWFVKNPSCEEVEVDSWSDDLDGYWLKKYKIIIPKEEDKKKHIVMLVGDKVNDEQTKCYCGHTTYCDCGPEEPKQTAVEWLHEKLATSQLEDMQKNINLWFKQAKENEKQQQDEFAIEFGKWLENLTEDFYSKNDECSYSELLEIFKKEQFKNK